MSLSEMQNKISITLLTYVKWMSSNSFYLIGKSNGYEKSRLVWQDGYPGGWVGEPLTVNILL